MSADPSQDLHRVWQRVQAGAPTAVFGRLPEPPPELHLLRVSCDVAPAELRPLIEARRRAEAILDEAQPLLDQARERVVSGLRRRLLGEASERTTEAVLVEVWNNLAKQTGHPWALVFEAVEAADAATLATLGQIVRRPGWLQLPLVLVFRGEPEGPAAELLATLRAHAGPDAVLHGDEAGVEEEARVDWRALPPAVLRVLRAGALIGPGFEAEVVAALLGQGAVEVIERLQEAADLGVPVEDRGEGRFSLPAPALAALARSILPSLAQAWHRRLGQLLSARAAEAEEPAPSGMSGETDRRAEARREGEEPRAGAGEAAEAGPAEADGRAHGGAAEAAGERAAGEEPRAGVGGGGEAGGAAGQVEEDRSGGTGAVDWSPEAVFASAPVEPAAVEAATHAAEEELAEEQAARAAEQAARGSGHPGAAGQAPRDSQAEAAEERRGSGLEAGEGRGFFGQEGRGEHEGRGSFGQEGRGEHEGRGFGQEGRGEHEGRTLPGADARAGHARGDSFADPLIDAVRAAEHLRMAGELDAAAERYCAAARAAVEAGAPQAGAQHARRAIALLARLPTSPGRRRIRVRSLI